MLFSQEKLSKAQKNKNYLEKLKNTEKYDGYKERKAKEQRERRQRKKEQEDELSVTKLNKIVHARRLADRERKQRSRAKKKNEMMKAPVNEPKRSYNTTATFGKALTKTKKSLPKSPSKKEAVLIKLLGEVQNKDPGQLEKVLNSSSSQNQSASTKNAELVADIRKFFLREDISVESPKADDVKKYSTDSGTQMLTTHHMTLTLSEAYGLFVQERENAQKGEEAVVIAPSHLNKQLNVQFSLSYRHLWIDIFQAKSATERQAHR